MTANAHIHIAPATAAGPAVKVAGVPLALYPQTQRPALRPARPWRRKAAGGGAAR